MLERFARWILRRKQQQQNVQQSSIRRTGINGQTVEVRLTQDAADVIEAIMTNNGKYLAICKTDDHKIAITNGLDYETTIDFFKCYAKDDEELKTMLTDMVIDLNNSL